MANSPRFDTSFLLGPALKSFGILVGRGEAAPTAKRERRYQDRIIGTSGDRIIGAATLAELAEADRHAGAASSRVPEARYAYYRRCQHYRRNGEQCKAPAMKGEAICHSHAGQLDAERRRAEQRRELLARPGAGFGTFRAIQRTISGLAQAILAGTIDRKTAGRLMVDIQTAIRLQKMLVAARRRMSTARENAYQVSRQPSETQGISPAQSRSSTGCEAQEITTTMALRLFIQEVEYICAVL